MRFVDLRVAGATLLTGAMLVVPGLAHAGHLGLGASGLATHLQGQTLVASAAYRGGGNRGGSFSAGHSVSHSSGPVGRSFVASSPQRFVGSQNFAGQQRFVNTRPVVNSQRVVTQHQFVNPQRLVGQQRFVTAPSFVPQRRYVRRGFPYVIGGLGVAGAYYYGNDPYYYDNGPYGVTGSGYDDDAVAYCVQTYGNAFDIRTMTYLAYDGRRYPCP